MKLRTLLLVGCCSLLVSCGGASAGGGKPASASGHAERESCRELAALVCRGEPSESTTCQEFRNAVELLPVGSCVEAMKEPEWTMARLDERRQSCRLLSEQLCQIMGEGSASCAMVKEQAPKLDSARCQNMLSHRDEVVSDLRQMERESAPLSPEDRQAIAAGDAPSFGPVNAKVTVVLFSDFECPYCAKAAEAVAHLKANYSDRVRVVFRQFPLSFHGHARGASEAALYAQSAGKFWEFHDALFKNQAHLEPDDMASYAKEVGLDPKLLLESLNQHAFEERIKSDILLGERVIVRGTPTLFINGKRSSNATSAPAVAAEVDAALAE